MADPKPPIPTLDEPIVPGVAEPQEAATQHHPSFLPTELGASGEGSGSSPREPQPPARRAAGPDDLQTWIESLVATVLERHMQAARREITERLAAEIRKRSASARGPQRG